MNTNKFIPLKDLIVYQLSRQLSGLFLRVSIRKAQKSVIAFK